MDQRRDQGIAGRALVVYESMFDNTAHAAEAVARGLRRAGFRAHAVPVHSLASIGPLCVDLVVAGAPTHTFTLSRKLSRQDAVRHGAPASRAAIGMREWIAAASPDRFGTDRLVVFDTRVPTVRRIPLAAAITAARLLRRRGFHLVSKPVGFLVGRNRGGLREGEEDRAEEWGRLVGSACREDLVAAG